MNCEICGAEDPDQVFLLPLHQKCGKLDTTACEKCAEKSGAWCHKHQRIHQGFGDGTTACLVCVKTIVEGEMIIHGEWNIYRSVITALSKDDALVLDQSLEMAVDLCGDDKAVALLSFIASKAFRTGRKFEEVLRRLLAERSFAFLLQ